jgi:hypothetical protein
MPYYYHLLGSLSMCKMFTKRTRAAYKFKSRGSIPRCGRRNFRLETHTVHARVFVSPCGARRPARLQFANPAADKRCGPIQAPPRSGLLEDDTGDKLPRATRRRTLGRKSPRPWARWAKRVQVSHSALETYFVRGVFVYLGNRPLGGHFPLRDAPARDIDGPRWD